MKNVLRPSTGFSLVELMIALVIGLFLVGAATAVFVAQSAVAKTTVSQAQIQNAENALSALVTPIIRGAGFTGCSSLGEVIATLNTGGPASAPALLNAVATGTPVAMITGYDALGTAGGGAVTVSNNAANSSNGGDWSQPLEPTLVGKTQSGSDVLVVLGAVPGFNPVAVTNASTISSTTLDIKDTSELVQDQYAAVTDCAKTSIFQITSISANSVTHATGTGVLTNASDYLPVPYAAASQVVGLQLSALYVAHDQFGDQSNLMRATYQPKNGTWTQVKLVPGIDNLQILYGVGDGTSITKYYSADNVSDWTKVNAVRLAFLVQGDKGSAATNAGNQYTLLRTPVTVPNDGRLRHVVEMTVNLRNAS